jgi:hypothetical protein
MTQIIKRLQLAQKLQAVLSLGLLSYVIFH